MERYELSYIDTEPFYYALTGGEIFTFPQFEVFEELECGGDVMRYMFPDGRSIIYLKNCPDAINNLIKEIQENNAPKHVASKYMEHPLSDESYTKLFCACKVISEMLNIECPQLEIRKAEGSSVYGESISEINIVILYADEDDNESIIFMVRYLAHELRHLWQYENCPEYYEVPQRSKSKDEYLNSPEENDAEAFANKLFMLFTGIDTIRENPGYAEGNAKVREKILKLEGDIDEGIIERLRNIFMH